MPAFHLSDTTRVMEVRAARLGVTLVAPRITFLYDSSHKTAPIIGLVFASRSKMRPQQPSGYQREPIPWPFPIWVSG